MGLDVMVGFFGEKEGKELDSLLLSVVDLDSHALQSGRAWMKRRLQKDLDKAVLDYLSGQRMLWKAGLDIDEIKEWNNSTL